MPSLLPLTSSNSVSLLLPLLSMLRMEITSFYNIAEEAGYDSTMKDLDWKHSLCLSGKKSNNTLDLYFSVFIWSPGVSLTFSQPFTWTWVHRNLRDLGACTTPGAWLLALFNLGKDLGFGDGIV